LYWERIELAGYIILVIGLLVVGLPVLGIITDHLNKQSQLKLEILKQEIELENLKNEGYLVETEKLRLEIEQTRQQLAVDHNSQIKLEDRY